MQSTQYQLPGVIFHANCRGCFDLVFDERGILAVRPTIFEQLTTAFRYCRGGAVQATRRDPFRRTLREGRRLLEILSSAPMDTVPASLEGARYFAREEIRSIRYQAKAVALAGTLALELHGKEGAMRFRWTPSMNDPRYVQAVLTRAFGDLLTE